MRALIDSARPLYDFVIDTAIDRFDTQYTTGQMGAVKAAAPLIAQIRDRSLLDLYTRKATRRIGIDLDIMQREVRQARRQYNVRDEDAYAPRRRQQVRIEERADRDDPYANPARRRELEHHDAANQTYFHIDDAVFICEQQFMATLIQIPRAIDREWFAQLTLANFMTPVFRTLFQAIAAAGGLPTDDTPQGLWMHNLTKAGGPMLQSVIDELAVMPLPLPTPPNQQSAPGAGEGQGAGVAGAPGVADVQLREPTQGERQYASELLARLLDIGYMRRIGAARRRMAQLPDGEEKIALLGSITTLETARKDLQAQVYNNTVG